jgi:hypothetical protein
MPPEQVAAAVRAVATLDSDDSARWNALYWGVLNDPETPRQDTFGLERETYIQSFEVGFIHDLAPEVYLLLTRADEVA